MQCKAPDFDDVCLFNEDWMGDLLMTKFEDFRTNCNISSSTSQSSLGTDTCAIHLSLLPKERVHIKNENPSQQSRREILRVVKSEPSANTLSSDDINVNSKTYQIGSQLKHGKKRASSRSSYLKTEDVEVTRRKLSKKEFIRTLFPTDLRYSYARIFADAFNTSNSDLIVNALKSFCAPCCSMREFFTGSFNPYGPNYRELSGIESIGNYWNIISSAMPDAAVTLLDTKVKFMSNLPDSFVSYMDSSDEKDTSSEECSELTQHNYANEGLVLICNYSFNGTKLLDIITEQKKNNCDNAVGSQAPSYGPSKIFLVPNMNSGSNVTPDVHIEGSWFIAMDRSNKIINFEFHYRNARETRKYPTCVM